MRLLYWGNWNTRHALVFPVEWGVHIFWESVPTPIELAVIREIERRGLCIKEEVKEGRTRSSGDGMEATCVEIPAPVRRREPKFVPYEPYKAAVKPIVPSVSRSDRGSKAELLEMHIPFPLRGAKKGSDATPVIRVLRRMHSDNVACNDTEAEQSWEHQKREMEHEIEKLADEKREMENQFKIQTKVNADLKKLLVASLGEDVQSKVQFLSEDKARLAQDIACYSQLIQEEHEELEKLAIQCDIWRSKFLASSMMVDELAQWKATLSHKYEESKEAIQWMLRRLQSSFDPGADTKSQRRPCDLLRLVHENRKLGESLHFRLLGSSGVTCEASPRPEQPTPAEEFARKVLQSKDAMADGLREKEHGWSFGKGFHYHPHFLSGQVTVNCCKHCSGEINVI